MKSKAPHSTSSRSWYVDGINPNNRYGFINQFGDLVIEPKFSSAFSFSEGLASICINSRMGFINTKGEIAIDPVFQDCRRFTEGLAYVEQGTTAGFINKKGKWAFKVKKELPYPPDSPYFSNGRALLRHGGAYRYFDKHGNIAIDQIYWMAQPFCKGIPALAAVFNEALCSWEYIDTNGNVIIRPIRQVSHTLGFEYLHAYVALDDIGAYGYIDQRGAIIHVNDNKMMSKLEVSFSSDMIAPASEDGKIGFINTYGQFVIKPIFQEAQSFQDGFAAIVIKGKHGYIDIKGKQFLIPSAERCRHFSEGLAGVRIKNKGWGYINTKGKFVIPPRQYKSVLDYREGLAVVRVQ